MMRVFVVLLLAACSACTQMPGLIHRPLERPSPVPPPPPSTQRRSGSQWEVGETKNDGIGTFRTLLSVHDGWHVFRTSTRGLARCLAVKPAEGESFPSIGEIGSVTGAGGYFIDWSDSRSAPTGSFYGRHWHQRIQVAEVDGRVVQTVDRMDAIRTWDGMPVAFEVVTTPYEYIWDSRHETRGTVDFTGIKLAIDGLNECRREAGHLGAPNSAG